MTAPQTLSAPPHLDRIARTLAASLPMSFQFVGDVDMADVTLVDGGQSWAGPTRMLVDRGAARIVVIDPGDDDPDAIVALSECVGSSATIVTLAEAYAGNPSVDPFRDELGDDFTALVIHGMAPVTVERSLLANLRVARALGCFDPVLRNARITGDGAIVTTAACTPTQRVVLRLIASATTAVAPCHRVRVYAGATLAEMTLHAGDIARPATTEIVRTEGLISLPTLYETANRFALRAPLCRVTGAAALSAFAADVALVRAIRQFRS